MYAISNNNNKNLIITTILLLIISVFYQQIFSFSGKSRRVATRLKIYKIIKKIPRKRFSALPESASSCFLTSGSLLCDHLTELYVCIYLTEPCLNITDYRLNSDWFNKTQTVYFVSKTSNTDWSRLYQ